MTKWVYGFGGGSAEGRADMRNLLGGKGAGLAAMTQAYETLRHSGKLPATYEVIHAICWGAEHRLPAHDAFPREAFIAPGDIKVRGHS